MNIAIIVDRFPQLSETFVLNQIVGLKKNGHLVHIYPITKSSSLNSHPEVDIYNLMPNTYYPPSVSNFSLSARFKFLSLVLKHHKFHPVFNRLRNMPYFQSQPISTRLRMLSILIPFLHDKKYDIIHCHFGQAANRAAFVRALGLLEGKMITTFYGYDLTLSSIDKAFYANLVKDCQLYICISKYLAERAVSKGISKGKISILPIGVNLDEFLPKNKVSNKNPIRLLTVARLVEKKGIYYSLVAVKSLLEKFPQVKYDIVGEGDLLGVLQELVDKLTISDHVIFHGPKNKTETLKFYQEADVFILPSVTASDGNTEGQGLVLQEAQAMEIPVVSTLHNGIPEGVKDGITGFLVPERNSEELANKITLLIKDPTLRIKMGKAGREFVQEKFDNEELILQQIQLYQKVLS